MNSLKNYDAILDQTKKDILEAIAHLEYSYKKAQKLSTDLTKLSSEELETWEGLVARFGRVSDLFLSKYVKTFVLKGDPGFRGTVRDFVDRAEKAGLLKNADLWMQIRELRNTSVHEYSKEKVPRVFEQVLQNCPTLMALKNEFK